MRRILTTLIVLTNLLAVAQTKPMATGEILHSLKKLNVVGTALYVAAHPDDENTLFIANM